MNRFLIPLVISLMLRLSADFLPSVDLTGALSSSPESVYASINGSGQSLVVADYTDGSDYYLVYSLYQSGTWTSGNILAPSTQYNAGISSPALNASGNAFVSWVQQNAGVFQIVVSFFNGTSWSTPQVVSGAQDIDTFAPVAYNDAGQAIVTWAQGGDVYASVYNGSSWSGPVTVTSTSNNYSTVSSLNNNGNVLLIWVQYVSPYDQVYYATYDFQTDIWSSPAALTTSMENHYNATAALNNSNQGVAVWQESSSNNSVVASIYNGSTWGTTTLISSNMPTTSQFPALALNDSGEAVVVWQFVPSSGNSSTQAIIYNSGSWGALETISDSNNSTNATSVAINNLGNAIAVWNQDYTINTHSANHSAHASTYNGSSWLSVSPTDTTIVFTPEVAPNTVNDSYYSSSVAMNNSGDAVVAWYLYDGTNYYVQASTNYATTTPLPPGRVFGGQERNKLPFQTQHFNQIQWSPSPSSFAVGYRIYRDGVLVATVQSPLYIDNSIVLNQSYVYEVASIDASGNQSSSVSLTISP